MSIADIAMAISDSVMAATPRPRPSADAAARCRIIAHRGEHTDAVENTLDAFRAARDAGVWAIECDIRWTADAVPVICHDPTPARTFGLQTPIADLTYASLREQLPALPSLAEVIDEFAGTLHLMLEIKPVTTPDIKQQRESLQHHLVGLAPAQDYHLLALDPAVFDIVDFVPAQAYLPVAEVNVNDMSKFALQHRCAGLAAHYLLTSNNLRQRHQQAGQVIGTGFPNSENCLRRELNRGIEWIFSNRAAHLEALRRSYL